MNQTLRLAAPQLWRSRGVLTRLLVPLSWAYLAGVRARRAGYRAGLLRVRKFPRPVVVVGGITVGGSGKTPLVMHVCRVLAEHGRRPGIVSRGYGGAARRVPLVVDRDTPAAECGDEPAMLARRLGMPVVVDRNRPRGVNVLLDRLGCDVVVSDDGLQHYAMDRQVEIAVIGGEESFGNGFCLPAGPLREPVGRLEQVDMVVANGAPAGAGRYAMSVRIEAFKRINGNETRSAADFAGRRVYAVAGIGEPMRFFEMLRDLGIEPETHPCPDHHRYAYRELAGLVGAPIVMTEKDAVKCSDMPLDDAWYAFASAALDEGFDEKLLELLEP